MIYTPEMLESLQKVNASRQRRLNETFRRMTQDERQEVLKKYHPDYIETAFRPLKVGPNKGGRTLHELADALEGRSRILPSFDLSQPAFETDVLVVGGGGAGASAALLAQEQGASVVVATKLRFGDANTMMAQGGIQAADRAEDSPAAHYLDVVGGGGYANDPDLWKRWSPMRPRSLRGWNRWGACSTKSRMEHSSRFTAAAPAASGCTMLATIPAQRSCARCGTRSATGLASTSSSSRRLSSWWWTTRAIARALSR